MPAGSVAVLRVTYFTDVLLKWRDGCHGSGASCFCSSFLSQGDTEPQHSLAGGGDKGGVGGCLQHALLPGLTGQGRIWSTAGTSLFGARPGAARPWPSPAASLT